MDEEQKEQKKPASGWRTLLMVLLILVIIFGLYLGLAWVLRTLNHDSIEPSKSPATTKTTSTKNTTSVNKDLVGTWDTGCLVPDPNSPWAERHTFTISSNGTAVHQRYSGDSCLATKADPVDNITYKIPANGQINLSYSSGVADGNTIYDIYAIADNTLKFGHGFCNCSTTGGQYGGPTEANRFTTLNNFLIYKK